MAARSIEDRFWAKVEKTDSCWNWTAALTHNGYGMFGSGQKRPSGKTKLIYAHRWSYQQAIGPIPEGLVIDHLCRNRKCVNPGHLEAVTGVENARRRRGHPNTNTDCRNGHPHTEETLYINPRGHRECRLCRNDAAKRAHHKRKNSLGL